MSINLNKWVEKYPEIDRNDLVKWVTDMALEDIAPEDYDEYIERKVAGEIPQPEDFKKNKETEPDKEEDDEETKEKLSEEPETEEKEEEPQQKEEDDEETKTPEETVAEDMERLRQQEKEEQELEEPDVPFENPDLSDLEVPEDDEDDEDFEMPDWEPEERPKARLPKEEMIKRTITIPEYEEIIKPYLPFFDDIKRDHASLNRLAANIDSDNLPPYMQLKPYIINHPIKDPNNTEVIIFMVSEANHRSIEQKNVQVTQAAEITRTLAEQGWYEQYMNNYDIIVEKLMEERRALVSLIYILENYCEMKQVSPFELSIPKAALMDSVESSFKNIKELITQNVLRELGELRGDLAGQMGGVAQAVEKNMGRFDTQIQDAITRVMWKVKTDVESTNMEDIKKSLLWILNKRSQSFNLGGGATSIMTVMLDDLTRRLMETGFKFDQIKEYRRYTIQELTNRLGYKKATVLFRAIPELSSRKLIKVYKNKTISL